MASCSRCQEAITDGSGPWCAACELHYDRWIRQHATDALWHAGTGASVAMLISLPLLGLAPALATLGVLAGASTFLGLRYRGKRRRRREFLRDGLPRAYLPSRT